eukprot:s17_g37.t1
MYDKVVFFHEKIRVYGCNRLRPAPPVFRASPSRDATFRPTGLFVQKKADAASTRPGATVCFQAAPMLGACSIGAAVSCPKGGSCQGNQCCPDGSTCPSADASFKGCGDVKAEDCTKVTEDMRLLLLSAISPMMRF